MHMNLTVDGQLLASVPVDPKRWKDEAYLNAITHLLAIKYSHTISAVSNGPLYYLQVPSKINRRSLSRK
jgi:hypothetical protein